MFTGNVSCEIQEMIALNVSDPIICSEKYANVTYWPIEKLCVGGFILIRSVLLQYERKNSEAIRSQIIVSALMHCAYFPNVSHLSLKCIQSFSVR